MPKNAQFTQSKISKIEAGRTMDTLVAKRVFGLDVVASSNGFYFENNGKFPGRAPLLELPRYSTNIAAAWKVVENLTSDYEITITRATGYKVGCLFIVGASEDWIFSEAETAPLAICRAALLAVTRAE